MKKYIGTFAAAAVFVIMQQGFTLMLPLIMSMILNKGVLEKDLVYVTVMGVVMLLVTVLGGAVSLLANYFSVKTATGFGAQLRSAVFRKVSEFSQHEFEYFGKGSLITRTTNDIQQVQDLILITLKNLISAPILIIGGAVMSFIMNKALAGVIFAVVPVIFILAFLIFKITMPLNKKQQNLMDAINRIVREKLTGIRVVRAFNREKTEDEKFDRTNTSLACIALKINRIFSVVIPVAYFLLYSILGVIVFVTIFQVNRMDAATQAQQIANTIGNFQAFIVYILAMILGVGMAAAMLVMVPRGIVSGDRIYEVLSKPLSVVNSKNAVNIEQVSEERGHLVFKDVTFCYPDAEEPVISDISFESRAGETTAFICSTGSGKSTIVNLIPRFFDINSGEILIDSVPVKDIEQENLRSKIGFIPQQAFLFSGTIADNLRCGKPDADEQEMWRALEIAQAADFVRAIPGGLDAPVSQSGKNMSGGQKQRIAIARAIIKDCEFLIFDDAFSALDFKTDAALRASLRENLSDRNVIIVAQRVSTVIHADRIIVLDGGKVCGMGTHEKLLENCRVYKEICDSQFDSGEVSSLG